MVGSLPVVNLDEAKYVCIYGRGCEGVCCRNGRPVVHPEEVEILDTNLAKALPHLTPAPRKLVEQKCYLSERRKLGLPMARVVEGWCVFFNQGCVRHKIGAAEGDSFRYKPAACALFRLAKDEYDRWYVRQKGFDGEPWDLFCLDPSSTTQRAAETLREEIALARRHDAAGGINLERFSRGSTNRGYGLSAK
jgi:hypothetical protein